MSTTYTKLRDGSWGLRSTLNLSSGQTVQVSKKDGSTDTKTVGRVLWTGNGVTLATVANSNRKSGGYRNRRNYDDDCELCGENRYECGHCIGW